MMDLINRSPCKHGLRFQSIVDHSLEKVNSKTFDCPLFFSSIHSEKGRSLLEGCKEQLQLLPAAKDAFAFNPAVLAPIQKPARYDEFWEGYGQKPFAALVFACCEPTKEELAQERRSKSLLARVMRRLKR